MGDKNRSPFVRSAPGAAGLALAMVLAACGGDDPAAALKREIGEMEAAVEARKPGEFLQRVTEDFAGNDGQVDKRMLHAMLASQLLGEQGVSVTLGPIDVRMHDADTATVKVSALVLGGRWLPERGETLEIESGWKRVGGEWRCYAAKWSGGQ